MSDEITQYTDEVRAAAAAMAKAQAELRDLKDAMDRGSVSGVRFREETVRLNAEIANLSKQAHVAATPAVAQQWTHATTATQNYVNGLNVAGKATQNFHYKLMVMGQGLDDLQYVGEMGLRPIINNLMMISPTIGIAAIAFDTLRKHGKELRDLGKGVFEYWGFDRQTTQANTFQEALGRVTGVFKDLGTWAGRTFDGLDEGWDQMTHGREKREAAKVKEYAAIGTPEEQERGKGIASAFDSYGRGKGINEVINARAKIDPSLRSDAPGSIDRRREEAAKLIDLIEAARKGTTSAIDSLELRMRGTGIGAHVADNDPAAVKRFHEEEEARKKHDEWVQEGIEEKRKERKERLDRQAEEVAGAGESQIGREIHGKNRGFQTRESIAKRLLQTGQAKDESEAKEIADAIYEKVFAKTWAKVRARVNATGETVEEAQKHVLQHDLATDQDKAHLAAMKQARTGLQGDHQSRADALADRIGDAAGRDPQVQQLQMMGRARLYQRLNFTDSAEARRFRRMDFAHREQFVAADNKRVDAQTTERLAQYLKRSGFTRDINFARGVAAQRVERNRAEINGQTGDQPLDENTKGLRDLNESIAKLEKQMADGVTVKLAE